MITRSPSRNPIAPAGIMPRGPSPALADAHTRPYVCAGCRTSVHLRASDSLPAGWRVQDAGRRELAYWCRACSSEGGRLDASRAKRAPR